MGTGSCIVIWGPESVIWAVIAQVLVTVKYHIVMIVLSADTRRVAWQRRHMSSVYINPGCHPSPGVSMMSRLGESAGADSQCVSSDRLVSRGWTI